MTLSGSHGAYICKLSRIQWVVIYAFVCALGIPCGSIWLWIGRPSSLSHFSLRSGEFQVCSSSPVSQISPVGDNQR